MTGEALYERYREILLKHGCGTEDFKDLESMDQMTWNELADSLVSFELARNLTAVIEDFLPNLRICALQDYGLLNSTLIEARAAGLMEKLKYAP